MKLNFEDIINKEPLINGRVIYVLSSYAVFSNSYIDFIKGIHTIDRGIRIGEDEVSRWGLSDEGEDFANIVEFSEFFNNMNVRSINGKWICIVNYSKLKDKQIEKVDEYEKKVNDNAVLIIKVDNWKDFNKIRRKKIFNNSKHTHYIYLDYPDMKSLSVFVKGIFRNYGVNISDEATNIFIRIIGRDYDSIRLHVDRICGINGIADIDKSSIINYMRGVEYHDIDDFVELVIKNSDTGNPKKGKKVYKAMQYLIDESDIGDVYKRFIVVIEELIKYRIAINTGLIPIGLRYEIDVVKSKVEDRIDIKKKSIYRFKRYIDIASYTTLEDLILIKYKLYNISRYPSKIEYINGILSVIHRFYNIKSD